MEKVSLELCQIGETAIQIISKTNSSSEYIKRNMINDIATCAEIAERHKGTPQQELKAYAIPDKVIVYTTYKFNSGIDIAEFLAEWHKII